MLIDSALDTTRKPRRKIAVKRRKKERNGACLADLLMAQCETNGRTKSVPYLGRCQVKEEGEKEVRVQIEIVCPGPRIWRTRKQKSFSFRKFGYHGAWMRAIRLKNFVDVKKRLPRATEEQDIFRRSEEFTKTNQEPFGLPCGSRCLPITDRAPPPRRVHPPPRASASFDWDGVYPSAFSHCESPYRLSLPLTTPEVPLLVAGGNAERVMRSRESPTLFHTCLPHVVSYLDLQSLCRVSGCSRLTMVILSTFSTIWQLRCQEILRSAPASATQESFFSSEFASLVAKARLISYHATTCVERMNQAAITGSDVNVWSERLDKCRSALNAMLRQTQDPSLVTILKSLYRINFSVAIDV